MRPWSLRASKLLCGQAVLDVITFVASIYHLPLRESLYKARQMLRPGGELAIVDLSANKSIADWTWAGLCTPAAGMGPWLHRETRNIGVLVAEPGESLGEIRRCLYDRYRLLWRNG